MKIIFIFLLFVTTTLFANGGSCSNAIAVNINSTTDQSLSNQAGYNRWNSYYYTYYKFTPTVNGTLTISTTDMNYNSDGWLYDNLSNCQNQSNYVASDTSNNHNINITYDIHKDTTYYLPIRNYVNHKDYFSMITAFTTDPAKANDDSFSTPKNTTLTDNVLTNDSGDTLSITNHTDPSNGTLTLNTTGGSFTYTPDTDYLGNDSFTYTIQDSAGNTDTATVSITIAPPYHESTGGRDFELRHQENLYGDVKVIGNTVLCKKNSAGECVESANNISNDSVNLQKAPQSSAVLTIPQNAVVKYARIYWQGRKAATSRSSAWNETSKNAAGKIAIKKDTGSFTQLTADILDVSSTHSGKIKIYHASADASSVVTGPGTYSIDTASFYTNTGKTQPNDGLGNYGAWTLVVVYEDPNTQTAKNISIFDGYRTVTSSSGSVDITTSGFLTPKANDVHSKLYVFVGEGDKYISGDHLKMAGHRHNTTLTDIAPIADNAFDSRIDVNAVRTPDLTNNNGIDIQAYNVGTNGKNIITNNETGAKFQFTSNQDTYFPSLVVFSTQLYAPKLCYDYTYGQNGSFVTAPVDHPSIDGTFDKNSPIDVKLYFQNQENSDITMSNLKVNVDPIDISKAKYSANSTFITPSNGTKTHILDSDLNISSNGSYLNDIQIGDLGSLGHFYTYYSLDANVSDISDMPINAELNYNLIVNVGGSTIDLGKLTSSIQTMDMCHNNVPYEPALGRFNVVQAGETKSADPYYYFNIPTQVVNRVGNFKLESMDPDDLNKSKAVTQATDVNITTVNMAGFHYTNATCTDPDNTIIIGRLVSTHFNRNTTIVPINKTAMRNANIFSRASQNAAFRIIYKDENNNTKTTCSRDNFAIRPESYSFKFTDYNHSNPIQKSSIIDNNGSTVQTVSLAAGYNYLFSAYATDHLNHTPVSGYNTGNVDANMTWQGANTLNCNNENNITLNPAFMNGIADLNKTWNDIGKYKLHIEDTLWTQVDSNPSYMQHHVSPYFKSGKDCNNTDSSVVQLESSSSYNGCNISSDHHNTENSQYFRDMYVVYHPYKFDLNATNGGNPITPSVGLLFTPVSNAASYVYISDINNSQDENMSYHLTGNIIALGENNFTLSNFTDNCYAVPLDINISTSNRDLNDSKGNHVAYQIRFHDINSTGSVMQPLDINLTETNPALQANDIELNTTKVYFPKDLNGSMQTRLNMNYVRENNTTINPKALTFIKYQVNCTNAVHDCTFNADLVNNKTTQGVKDLNATIPIKYYYGRAHAAKQRYEVTGDNQAKNANLYYEIYCYKGDCNTSMLPNPLHLLHTDDIRWYQNTDHNVSNDGNITNVNEKGAPRVSTSNLNTTTNPSTVDLSYDGSMLYPYQTTMEINASKWLIYNPDGGNLNEFQAEFYKANTNWSGEHETNSTTNVKANKKDGRRVNW